MAAAAAEALGLAVPRDDAALALGRCGLAAEAKPHLEAALATSPGFHRARALLGLYRAAAGGEGALDAAIAELERAARDSRFQNVEALVVLATLQMRRGGTRADDDGASDLDRARKNLQRALAIDDGCMPALNQLALHQIEVARRVGRAHRKNADAQALELALLVASQGLRKAPAYAPLHNTAGLLHVELGDLSRAVAEFNEARRLDAGFFEAHMNAAAVNLGFRGFAEAERAYRAALTVRPRDYEAHLGLALAIRGQIDDGSASKGYELAAHEIEAARALAPDRPEAYFNAALLTLGFKARATGQEDTRALGEARSLFGEFIARAEKTPELAGRVADARARLGEIDTIMGFAAAGAGPAGAQPAVPVGASSPPTAGGSAPPAGASPPAE